MFYYKKGSYKTSYTQLQDELHPGSACLCVLSFVYSFEAFGEESPLQKVYPAF